MSRAASFALFFGVSLLLLGAVHYYVWARLVRDPALTPRELARRWTSPGSAEQAELTELYYAVE